MLLARPQRFLLTDPAPSRRLSTDFRPVSVPVHSHVEVPFLCHESFKFEIRIVKKFNKAFGVFNAVFGICFTASFSCVFEYRTNEFGNLIWASAPGPVEFRPLVLLKCGETIAQRLWASRFQTSPAEAAKYGISYMRNQFSCAHTSHTKNRLVCYRRKNKESDK